jgi:hypothetical protein
MTFENEFKNAISRQNQSCLNLLEQLDELDEIIEKYYIKKSIVREAIEKRIINCKQLHYNCICYQELRLLLKDLGIEEK